MEVGDGEEAGLAWERMLRADIGIDEKGRLKRALLAYCGQDTWALAALLSSLREKRQRRRTTVEGSIG
jgi:hypothetical protein